jgi:hypothetical protein
MRPETLTVRGAPVVGFGEEAPAPPARSTSPWTIALATSVVSAAAGWTIEEVAKKFRKKRR